MGSIFIVDNGSYSIKAGHKDDLKPKIIPNYIFKTSSDSYIGNEIDKCLEPSNLYLNSPFERGYLVHMDIQNEIWQDIFGRRQFGLDFSDTKLVLTDSNLTVPTIETSVREILFETYGFHSLQLASAPGLVAQYYYEKTQIPHSLIIDSGHSFTHILPCLSGKICVERSMRIDVGGKIMTNFLRDKLTYSQYDLRQETKVVNEMKEDVCYFAKDFRQEMEIFKKNNPVINYYLPDYNLIRRGQIKQSLDSESFKDLSTISLGVERFVLPETIFFPEIIDCDQIGLKEAINRTCNGVFNYNLFGRYMLKNIIVFGGNASIPGLKERLCHDLSNAFETYDVPENIESCINISSHPISEPWHAAQYLINNNVPSFLNKFVTKKEYHEHGNRICDERFFDYAPKEWYEHVEDGPFVDENGMTVVDTDDEFETTCNSKAEKPVTFENQVTEQINISSSSHAATIVHDQFSNDIIIPQSPTNDVDTDIMEVDYVPPSTRPIIRTILKPRRAVPSVGTVSVGQQPTIIQKVVAPQRLIKCPDQNSHLPNVQYYTTISEGSKPLRFIQLRPARILPDFQQQQRFQSRLPVIPSSSIIRIRSPIASTSNIRSPNQQIQSSEMPILHPQIARQVPIMLPRGMLPSSSIGGPGSASFRGRTIVVRRTIPRSQYIALQQRHQQPSQQSVLVMPSANFQPQPGLEEEYESGESGPSTPL